MTIHVSKQLTRNKDKEQFTISDDEYRDQVSLNIKRGNLLYLLTKTLARVQRGKAGKVNAFQIPGTDKFMKQIYTKSLLDAQHNAINAFWANSVLYRIGGRKRSSRKNTVFVHVEKAMMSFFRDIDFGDSYQVFERRGGKPVMKSVDIRVEKANGFGTSTIEVHRGANQERQLFEDLVTLQKGYATSDTVRNLIHIARRLNGKKKEDGSIIFDATQIEPLNAALNQPCKYVRTDVHAEEKKKKDTKNVRKSARQGTGFSPVSTKMLNNKNISWLKAIQNFKAAYERALLARGVDRKLITEFNVKNITSADIMAMMWFDVSSATDARNFDLGAEVSTKFKELRDKSVPSALREDILEEQRIVEEFATLLKEDGIGSQKQRAYDRSSQKKAVPKARKVAPLK